MFSCGGPETSMEVFKLSIGNCRVKPTLQKFKRNTPYPPLGKWATLIAEEDREIPLQRQPLRPIWVNASLRLLELNTRSGEFTKKRKSPISKCAKLKEHNTMVKRNHDS